MGRRLEQQSQSRHRFGAFASFGEAPAATDPRPGSRPPLGGWKRIAVDLALPAILLGVLCSRIWNIGIMHTDDATWALAAWQPGSDVIGNFARSQGRLWAFPSGLMMLHTLAWQNSVYTEILRLGGFCLFFLLFHLTVADYCGRRVALLSAGLFLAFFSLTWDGSILVTYPNVSWIAGSCFMVSLLLCRAYFVSERRSFIIASGTLLFVSLFTNEGCSLLFATLYPLALAANLLDTRRSGENWFEAFLTVRSRRALLAYGCATGVFLFLAVGWSLRHASQYDGHSFAPLDLKRIATVLVSFATSGLILHDFVSPYFVNYSDALTATGTHAVYAPSEAASEALRSFKAIAVGGIAATMILWALRAPPTSGQRYRPVLWGVLALITGIVVAVIPLLPVAATSKYQNWYFDLGVGAYSQSLIGAFGGSLFLAGLLSLIFPLQLVRGRLGGIVLIVLALSIGTIAAIADRRNDDVAFDMRPEGGRWRVLALALDANDKTRTGAKRVWAPRFASGSWFTVVPLSYWSDYSKARYGADVTFVDKPLQAGSSDTTALLDYRLADDQRTFLVVLTRLQAATGGGSTATADRIVVAVEQPNATELRHLVVCYRDMEGINQQVALRDVQPFDAGGRIFVLDKISADPASVRLSQQSVVKKLPPTE